MTHPSVELKGGDTVPHVVLMTYTICAEVWKGKDRW
jgi:hypothetical protein